MEKKIDIQDRAHMDLLDINMSWAVALPQTYDDNINGLDTWRLARITNTQTSQHCPSRLQGMDNLGQLADL